MKFWLKDFPVYGVTSDFPLASIGFLPIITLQCTPDQLVEYPAWLSNCLSKSNHSTNDWYGNHCNQNHNEEWQRHESQTTWCQFSINNIKIIE